MTEPIRLFVGTSAQNEDLEAQMVLEHSARKHCSLPLEITWMRQSASGPWGGWRSGANGRTPFSAFRWGIPAACGFAGRAIYSDLDFIYVADLAELWGQYVPGVLLTRKSKKPGGKLRTCCMLFDCARAKGHLPDLDRLRRVQDPQGEYSKYFQRRDELTATYRGDWNAIDAGGYADLADPRIKAIHYSRIETQLHLKYAVPRLQAEGRRHWYTGEIRRHEREDLIALFDGLYAEALAAGRTPEQYRVPLFSGATRKDFAYKEHKGKAIA